MKVAIVPVAFCLGVCLTAAESKAAIYTLSFSGTASGEDYSGILGPPATLLTDESYVATYTLNTDIAEASDSSGPGHNTEFFFGGYTYGTPDPINASIAIAGRTFNFKPSDTTAQGSAFLSDIYDLSPNVLSLYASAGDDFHFGSDLNSLYNGASLAGGVVTSSYGQFSLATAAGLGLQVDLTTTEASTSFPISPAPEPPLWAMMIVGMTVAGAALRFNGRRGWAVA